MSSSSSDTDSDTIQDQIATKSVNAQSTIGAGKNAQNKAYSNKKDSKSIDEQRKDKHKLSMETEYYDYFYSSDFEYEYEYEYDFEPSEKFTKAQAKSTGRQRKSEPQVPKPKKQDTAKKIQSEHEEEEEEIVPEIEEIVGTYAAYFQPKGERAKYSDKPYYVKYKDEAYMNAMWMSQKEIAKIVGGDVAIEKFNALSKKFLPTQSLSHPFLQIPRTYVDSSWYQPERVINDAPSQDQVEYLIKWRGRTYNDASWESPNNLNDDKLIEKYKARLKLHISRKISPRVSRPNPTDYQVDKDPIISQLGIDITPNQRDAMNWIVKQFYNGKNSVISSDHPMISIVASVCALQRISKALKQPGGYLIICKDEDIYLWKDALDQWTSFDATMFYGDRASRDLINEVECTVVDDKGNELPNDVQFDVMIVSYIELKRFMAFIEKFDWRYIIADSAGDTKKTALALTKSLDPGKAFGITVIQDGKVDVAHYKPIIDYLTKEKENASGEEICQYFEADFPSTEIINVPVDLSPEQIETLLGLMNDSQKDLVAANSPTGSAQNEAAPGILRLLIMVRQAIAHPFFIRDRRAKLVSEDERVKDIGRFSAKFVIAERMAKSEKYGRLLIFAQLPGVMEILSEHFRNCGIKYEITSSLDTPSEFYKKINSKKNVILATSKGGSRQIPLGGFDTILILDNDSYTFSCPGKRVIRLIARGTIEEYLTYEGYSQMVYDDLDQTFLGRLGRYPIGLLPAEHILQWSAYTVLEKPERTYAEFLGLELDEILDGRVDAKDISKHIDSSEFWMGALAKGVIDVSESDRNKINAAIDRVIDDGIGLTKDTYAEDAQVVRIALNMIPTVPSNLIKRIVRHPENPFNDDSVVVVLAGRANEVCASAIMFEKLRRALYRLTINHSFPKFTEWGSASEAYSLLRTVYLEGLNGDLFRDFPDRKMDRTQLLSFINSFLKYAKQKMPPPDFAPEEDIRLVETGVRAHEMKSDEHSDGKELTADDDDEDSQKTDHIESEILSVLNEGNDDDSQEETVPSKEQKEDFATDLGEESEVKSEVPLPKKSKNSDKEEEKDEDDEADDEGDIAVEALGDCPEGMVVRAAINHGLPNSSKLSYFLGDRIDSDTVEDVRKELLDAIEQESFENIDVLKPVQKLLNADVLHNIKNAKKVFDRAEVYEEEPFDLVDNIEGLPEWWSQEVSKYYIESLLHVGASAPFRMIAKQGGAMIEQIPKEKLDVFKKASKLEKKHLPVDTALEGFEFMDTYEKRLNLAARILKIELC